MQQVAEVSKLVDSKLAAKQTQTLNRLYQLYVGKGGQTPENVQ
jgi:hypothetical protein